MSDMAMDFVWLLTNFIDLFAIIKYYLWGVKEWIIDMRFFINMQITIS